MSIIVMPKSRAQYGAGKINKNILNDKKHHEYLINSSWQTLTIYKYELIPAMR